MSVRPSSERDPQAQISNRRLAFVTFALVLLVLVPGFTSIFLNLEQHALLEAMRSTRVRLADARERDATIPNSAAAAHSGSAVEQSVAELTRQEGRLRGRSATIRTIQLALTVTLGLLGLLACWYTHRTLWLLRRNFTDLDAQRRKLEGLFDTASHLSVNMPDAMNGFLTERVASLLEARKAVIWGYNAQRAALIPLLPAHGFESAVLQGLRLPARGEDPVDAILARNVVVSHGDMDGNAAALPLLDVCRSLGVTSLLAAPLIAHGEPVGLLLVHDKVEGGAFTAEDSRILRIFAGQAAFVVHSGNLYARSVARGEQITAMANVSAALGTSLDLRDAMLTFVREARAIIPFDTVRIGMLPTNGCEPRWDVAERKFDPTVDLAAEAAAETVLTRRIRGHVRAPEPDYAAGLEASGAELKDADARASCNLSQLDVWSVRNDEVIHHGAATEEHTDILMRAVTAGRSLLVSLRRGDPIATDKPAVTGTEGHAAAAEAHRAAEERQSTRAGLPGSDEPAAGDTIVIPLWGHDAIFGALQIESDAPDAFTRTHLVLARQLAGQVAAVVQNVRLYQETRRRAEQLQWGIQETHHRIKNNLQAVSAILDLHLMGAGATVSSGSLRHALLQVRSIATVHDLLNEDIQGGTVPAKRLLDTLAPLFVAGTEAQTKAIDLHIEATDDRLPSRIASAVALTANELVSNAIIHGGKGRDEVSIAVDMRQECGQLVMSVRDDGGGFPQDFGAPSQNIGLTLVQMLIERDLGGAVDINNRRPGAQVTVTVPFA